MELCFSGSSGATCNHGNSNVSFFCHTGSALLLVDCPGDLSLKAEKSGYDLMDLELLILTHSHPDHIYGLPQLMQHFILLRRSGKLRIAANPATAAAARSLLKLFHQDEELLDFPIEWIVTENSTVFKDRQLQVDLIPVEHSIPTSGVAFRTADTTVLYSADTGPGVLSRFAGLKPGVLIHESSGLSMDEKQINERAHSSARQAAAEALAVGAERLFLCHFSDNAAAHLDMLKKEAERVFAGEVLIPETFQRYRF
jgi:ribonuclease Z